MKNYLVLLGTATWIPNIIIYNTFCKIHIGFYKNAWWIYVLGHHKDCKRVESSFAEFEPLSSWAKFLLNEPLWTSRVTLNEPNFGWTRFGSFTKWAENLNSNLTRLLIEPSQALVSWTDLDLQKLLGFFSNTKNHKTVPKDEWIITPLNGMGSASLSLAINMG